MNIKFLSIEISYFETKIYIFFSGKGCGKDREEMAVTVTINTRSAFPVELCFTFVHKKIGKDLAIHLNMKLTFI